MLDNFPPNGVTGKHLQITNNKEMPEKKTRKQTKTNNKIKEKKEY